MFIRLWFYGESTWTIWLVMQSSLELLDFCCTVCTIIRRVRDKKARDEESF